MALLSERGSIHSGAWRAYSIGDGAIGGLIGGMLMGMVSMVLFPMLELGGFWQPMNLIAALFNQEWGRIAGFALLPSMIGMMVHLMMSAGLGAVFAWTASRTGGNLVVKAVLASLVVWALMDFLVLPIVNPIMDEVFVEWLFALVHVVYGVGLGGYLMARGRQSADREAMSGASAATRV